MILISSALIQFLNQTLNVVTINKEKNKMSLRHFGNCIVEILSSAEIISPKININKMWQ